MQLIKWTSLIMIFILANILGNVIARKYKNREKQLKDMKMQLNTIETKIKFTQQPIKEIFEDIIQNEKNGINKIFATANKNMKEQNIEQAWYKAIEENKCKLNLTDEDLNIIGKIGKMLGKTDVEGQIKEIEITKQFVEKQIEKAEIDRAKNEKMYKVLGGIAGIGIVIILV